MRVRTRPCFCTSSLSSSSRIRLGVFLFSHRVCNLGETRPARSAHLRAAPRLFSSVLTIFNRSCFVRQVGTVESRISLMTPCSDKLHKCPKTFLLNDCPACKRIPQLLNTCHMVTPCHKKYMCCNMLLIKRILNIL